ncbi:DUF693 family protein, partial [Borreliella afzelii]
MLLSYDFKIEFYNEKQSLEKDTSGEDSSIEETPQSLEKDTSGGDSLIEETPKIIINTQYGIHVDISISNMFS